MLVVLYAQCVCLNSVCILKEWIANGVGGKLIQVSTEKTAVVRCNYIRHTRILANRAK